VGRHAAPCARILCVALALSGCQSSGAGRPAGGTSWLGRATARPRDAGEAVSTSPATDPLLGDAARRRDPNTIELGGDDPPGRGPRVAAEPAKAKSALPADPPGSDTAATAAQYRALRTQLERMGAKFSSERVGQEYVVHCEVPTPGDANHWEAFDTRSADELAALRSVTLAAEQWLGARKGRATADPTAP